MSEGSAERVGTGRRGVPSVLERILESTREELELRKRELPVQALARQLGASERWSSPRARRSRLREALAGPSIGVIAEFKRRSPSAGELRPGADVGEVVRAYERGGACALSVLTEGPNFGGSLEDLLLARSVTELPILRKDFIVDDYQLYEARAAGADAVLLIVAALEQAALRSLHDRARELDLEVLVEVHDREELQVARRLGAALIGINNRDLHDFTVEVERTSRLIGDVPPGARVVSESGIHSPQQLRNLARQGVAAVLVGESLMRAPDPEAALRALCAVDGSG